MENQEYERYKLMREFEMKFLEDFEKSIHGFTNEEQIDICGLLSNIAKRFKNKEDYEKVFEEGIEPMLLKYKSRLGALLNCKLTDYFVQDSMKLIDLMHEKKTEDYNQFLNDDEYTGFMRTAINLLSNHRHFAVLQIMPEQELSGKEDVQEADEHKNPDFTTRRRVLFLHYLDKKFKFNGTGDKKPLNEIAHFLTGNNIDNLYKHLRNPLGTSTGEKRIKSEQLLKKDLEYVKRLFERLEQPEIMQMIDKDIQSV